MWEGTVVDQEKKRRERNLEHPEKQMARSRASWRRKLLIKDKCEKCGATEHLEMHHPDYSRPLYIQTLCTHCHHSLRVPKVK
jgi:hypothetical protein